MAEKVLGPKGSKRRRRFLFVPALLVAVAALFFVAGAQAVHDLAFQLDGDVTASTVTNFGGHTQSFDWDSFFNSSGQSSPALPAASRPGFTASAFARDFNTNANGSFNTSDSTTFTTGSKDTLNITPGWQCTFSNNVNSKTDLSNVYAVAYTNPANGHQFIYFGLERNDNSGDGNIAFWFLQDNVGCQGTTSGVNVPFTGNHKDGDLLVVSSFTNGGSVSNVTAYRWNGGANGSLGTTPVAGGGDCKSSTLSTGDVTCATVNVPTIQVPWLTANKNDGTGHALRESEFFEGGIDLFQSGLQGKCFSSFLGDTRSSQSLTATIFDFAGGSFQHCSANISIAPNAVNQVGQTHTFTVTIGTTNAGTTSPAPDGTHATVTLTPSGGAVISNLVDNCGASGPGTVNGTCTVSFTSNSAGTVSAHAAADVTIQGQSFHLETNGQNGNSGDATKRFVDANVSISPPSSVNEVNHSHQFTITSTAFPAGTTATITSITPSVSPQPTSFDTSDCASPHQSGNTATCTVTINNSSAGLFTINAVAVWHFADGDPGANPASADVTRSTSGNFGPGGSGPATKQFVDAFITITPPEATNNVGQPHTFIVTVMKNEGLGAGFVPAANLPVTVTLTNDATSNWAFTGAGDLCASPNGTNGSGQCTVTFTSPTAGTVTGTATVTFTLDGVQLTRTTDGHAPNSGPAIKHFVAGQITWLKVDNAGRPLGGATFQLCRTNDYDFATNSISSTALNPPVCITVSDNGQNDEDQTVGSFKVSGEPLGRYTIQETQAPAGYVIQTNTQTVNLVPGSTNGSAAVPFVNGRPVLKISGFGYTNVATPGVSQPDGIFSGTTTYTVNLHNYGTAASNLSSSSLVVSSNANCGLGGNTLVLDGMQIPAGGDSGPITMTCTYNHPSPTAITATLTVNDLTNGLLRAASGSPATITFTVNPG